MLKWLKSPKAIPYLVVSAATLLMFIIIHTGQLSTRTFPLMLFIGAKLSIIFGAIEIGLAYLGRYQDKDEIYQAISRAITSLGMAMCFILLVGAFEAAKR